MNRLWRLAAVLALVVAAVIAFGLITHSQNRPSTHAENAHVPAPLQHQLAQRETYDPQRGIPPDYSETGPTITVTRDPAAGQRR